MLGADEEPLITSAAAIEMLHTATLVHDDLIDGALMRRGSPTLNANWTPAKTVLTGDLIFSYAALLAAETDSVRVMHLFAETLATIVNGEITQEFANRGQATREDYYRRIHAKTASLFEAAAASAAYLSPVGDDIIDIVRRYGYEIGMAFQIIDDVLDFTGNQDMVGKPIGSDLRQGLITLPALCYFEQNNQDTEIIALMNGDGMNNVLMENLIEAIRESDAIEKSMKEAEEFIQRSEKSLIALPDGVERHALMELANYVVNRVR
jgi:geranylgeranyl pyrophosphate synthase